VKPRHERITGSDQASFRFFVRRERRYAFNWHYHPEYELTLITRGTGTRFVGDDVTRYTAPNLVLIGPDLPHTWLGEIGDGPHEAIVVQFGSALLGLFANAPEFTAVTALLARARQGTAFAGDVCERSTKMLLEMERQSPRRRLRSLLEVLDELADAKPVQGISGPRFESRLDAAARRRIDEVIRYVGTHYRSEVSQPEAARIAGLSTAAFSRFFRRATNKTFVSYVQELRLSHACDLLMHGEESVTTICFASGFANIAHFNRCFRRSKGLTPRDFRKRFAIYSH